MFKKGDVVTSKLNGRKYVLVRFSAKMCAWAVDALSGRDQSYLPESWMKK